MAGILNCTGEKCVVIDVDLQDQPELIEQLSSVPTLIEEIQLVG